jgi:hypothetical protein
LGRVNKVEETVHFYFTGERPLFLECSQAYSLREEGDLLSWYIFDRRKIAGDDSRFVAFPTFRLPGRGLFHGYHWEFE